jgi:hypothetical protein
LCFPASYFSMSFIEEPPGSFTAMMASCTISFSAGYLSIS